MIMRYVRSYALWLVVLSLILSGCKITQQDARYLFSDGVLPRPLERIANQRRELPVQRLSKRLSKDQSNKSLLPVAVIDNGFDLGHPLLLDRFIFEIENGQIKSAGFDPMGRDSVASANLIKATLYAYSGNGLKNGLIVPSKDEPLDLMYQHQLEFFKILKAKVAANPGLKNTIFARKLEFDSVYFSEVAAQLKEWKNEVVEQKKSREERRERELKEGKKIISEKEELYTEDPKDLGKEVKKGDYMILWPAMYKLYFQRWNKLDGQAVFDHNAFNFPKGLEMKETLIQAFEEFDSKFKVLKRMENLAEFAKYAQGEDKPVFKSNLEMANDEMFPALQYKINGYLTKNPIYTLIQHLKTAALTQKMSEKNEFPTKPLSLKKKDLIVMAHKLLDEVDQHLDEEIKEQSKADSLEVLKLKKLKTKKNWIRERLIAYVESVSPEAIETMDPRLFPRSNALERHILRTTHPYISSASNTESHGTHVSGTIAIQDPNIRIYPIRVVTSAINMNEPQVQAMQKALIEQLSTWLKNPMVFQAFRDKLKLFFASHKKKFESLTEAEIIEDFVKEYRPYINTYASEHSLDIVFLGQILESIEHVGQKQLKLVNMSLGLENQAKVSRETESLDITARKQQEIKFLIFEMMKYRIGKQIQEKAPQTLFVVAAGNSSKWIDAEAQSAVPVDISSPWLRRFESATMVAPNNHLKNILGVGSIAPSLDRLSSFTNLIMGSSVPVIFAVGEDVTSTIKTTDKSLVESVTNSLMPNVQLYAQNYGMRVTDEVRKEREENPLNRSLMDTVSSYVQEALMAMSNTIILDQFLSQDVYLGRMAGTSMATPNVVGMLAKLVIAEMKKRGLTYKDIYHHPDFTPAAMVEMIMKQATPLRSGNIVEELKKVSGEKEYSDRNVISQIRKNLYLVQPKKMEAPASASLSCKKLVSGN